HLVQHGPERGDVVALALCNQPADLPAATLFGTKLCDNIRRRIEEGGFGAGFPEEIRQPWQMRARQRENVDAGMALANLAHEGVDALLGCGRVEQERPAFDQLNHGRGVDLRNLLRLRRARCDETGKHRAFDQRADAQYAYMSGPGS